MKIIVYHASFDCDTGCCGHVIETDDPENLEKYHFEFNHPYDRDPRAFAEDMVRSHYGDEHVKDLDWENCIVGDYC